MFRSVTALPVSTDLRSTHFALLKEQIFGSVVCSIMGDSREDCGMNKGKRKNHVRAMEFLRRLNAESQAPESGL
jgi:hypothetical protein